MKDTYFDTDMFIHFLSIDTPVQRAAENEFIKNRPSKMSEFTIVEFKGNYIQCLILLRRKISDSDSLESAAARVSNTGGRKAYLMFAQLFKLLGGRNVKNIEKWNKVQNVLLTYLDSQIQIVWEFIINKTDTIDNEFNCTRATEEPEDNNGNWSASIPKCNSNNSNCIISDFLMKYCKDLESLVKAYKNIEENSKTPELEKIYHIVRDIVENKNFDWRKNRCRQIGDLLIGLQSKSGSKIISSNYKEHRILSKYLDYKFEQFNISKLRSK